MKRLGRAMISVPVLGFLTAGGFFIGVGWLIFRPLHEINPFQEEMDLIAGELKKVEKYIRKGYEK